MPEFTYEKVPFVEVISEIHWNLKPLVSIPDTKMQSNQGVKAWFDNVHVALHKNFGQTVSTDLKSRFGKQIEVTE